MNMAAKMASGLAPECENACFNSSMMRPSRNSGVRSVPPYEGEPRRIDTSTPVVVVGMVGWEVARW